MRAGVVVHSSDLKHHPTLTAFKASIVPIRSFFLGAHDVRYVPKGAFLCDRNTGLWGLVELHRTALNV